MLRRLDPLVVRAISRVLANKPEVLAGYIFGSVVSGRARPNSDIDIGVLIDEKVNRENPLKYRLDLMADLGSALKRIDVDVVLMNEAPSPLAQNIIVKGKLVFERSRSARVAFQVKTLNVFLDTEPMRQLQLQYLKRRYLKGRASG
jgi:predicted nucleotidyltransferase